MDRNELIESFHLQAGWCQKLGSPLYHALLERIADDIQSSGACWKALEPYAAVDPRRSLLPLRLLGAIHRQVLEGRIPKMAASRFYPSYGPIRSSDSKISREQSRSRALCLRRLNAPMPPSGLNLS